MKLRLALALFSMLAGLAAQEASPDPVALQQKANEAYERKDWGEAARLFRQSAEQGFSPMNSRYNGACGRAPENP